MLLLALPLFAQTPPAPPAGEGSTLEVKPGPPAVKTTEPGRKPVDPWKRLPGYLLQDQKAIWSSPFRTRKANARWWFIFGGATAALIAADKHIAGALPNTSAQVAVATWTSRIGAAYTLAPLDGAIYLLGVGTHNDRLRETGFLGAEALGDTLVVQTVLKAVTHRERPSEGNGDGRFWSGTNTLGSSFPSGHAMQTWAFASVIAHEYPHPRIVPIAAYALAVTVSGSRMAARRHFAADVVAGAAIGWFIGDYVFAKRHNRALGARPSKISKALARVRFGFSVH